MKLVINKNPEIKKLLEKTNFKIDSPEDWTPTKFDNIIDGINKQLMSNVIGKDKSNILEVLELMEKERRFNFKEESSLFIEAMTQGEWVLLNGIELYRVVEIELTSLFSTSNLIFGLFNLEEYLT